MTDKEKYLQVAANILETNLRMEELTFLQRYRHNQHLEKILAEWVDLRLMTDELAAPKES